MYDKQNYIHSLLIPSVLVAANLLANFCVSFSFCKAWARMVWLPPQNLTLFVTCLSRLFLLFRTKACLTKVFPFPWSMTCSSVRATSAKHTKIVKSSAPYCKQLMLWDTLTRHYKIITYLSMQLFQLSLCGRCYFIQL